MKLDPTKFVFGFNTSKFLGFMVIERGIKVNPDQIKFVLEKPTLNSKKELQRLIVHFVALGRFVACFTDKLRFFFLTLKRSSAIG